MMSDIKADILTTAALIGELFDSGISNAVGTAEIVDVLIELISGNVKDTGFGFSIPGLAVGISYSALITLGSMYAHYMMNKNNQASENHHGYSSLPQDEENANIHQQNPNTFTQLFQNLKWYQLLAVLADLLSDTGAKMGIILSVLKIALDGYNKAHTNSPLSKATIYACKGTGMVVGMIGGLFSSLADVRSVAMNMAEMNEKEKAAGSYSP